MNDYGNVRVTEDSEDRIALDAAFKADAIRQFERLRKKGPVHPVTLSSGLPGWLVVSYAAAREALTHPALGNHPAPAIATLEAAGYVTHHDDVNGGHMLASDPPNHTRLRRLVAGAFTTKRVQELRQRIEEIANSLIDSWPSSGQVDLVSEFTAPLPVTVIAELIGVPEHHRNEFRKLTGDALAVGTPQSEPAFMQLRALLTGLIDEKSKNPEDDLTSALIAARDDDDSRLSDQELLSMLQLLLIAGHETTVNLMGNAIMALMCHPDQLEILRNEPVLIASAAEEFLRYDSPLELSTLRFAAEDLKIGGTLIEKGSIVVVALASANRDVPVPGSGVPGTLDVTRKASRHLAFGHGIHHCLGAPLARLEFGVAMEILLRRLQHLELAVPYDEIDWISKGIMRGALKIPVRYRKDPGGSTLLPKTH
ncbi:cytochrome P450 family protein [Streptomyces cadmiisoli]|uniref:cytochrome P450 family protein n=1 Tax=Streptomyces cadmiisoli TaxID=2184053 RepID=UPI001FE299F2|nr:cytochrome P450 [Streptomyces cadmiisoli]